MKGRLIGIGVGPGDPDLLTLKAVKAIQECDVVAVPSPENSDRTAFFIVEKYLEGKQLLECKFSMEIDLQNRKESRANVGKDICKLLEEGKTVGFITLGDPCIYSTYMYIHKIVTKEGFQTEIVPGITSFSAASAVLNTSLCEGEEMLHIIPASCEYDIEKLIQMSGNKVIMKSGRKLKHVLSILKQKGLSDRTQIVERCTMEDQRIFTIDEFEKVNDAGYFCVVIVKE